jgi:hypothetical protein
MELADFTAVLDEMTRNTYILVIVHDSTIGKSHGLHPRDEMARQLMFISRNCGDQTQHSNSKEEV